MRATSASVVITHPESLSVALSASRATKLPADRIILFNVDGASYGAQTTVQNVIDEGLASTSTFQERVLQPGEGKTKVAFLNFSSGTTGKPKVWILEYRHDVFSRVACMSGCCDTPLCTDSQRYPARCS